MTYSTRVSGVIAGLLLLSPISASAAMPFDGTWVVNKESVEISGGKAWAFLLQDGMYSCLSCTPVYKVPADGKAHPVKGQAYFDSVLIKIVDANTVERTTTLAGKPDEKIVQQVAPDGNSMTDEFEFYNGNTKSTGKSALKRTGPAPSGAHAVSGSWREDPKNSDVSTEILTTTYKQSADGLQMTSPTGTSFDAKFDGKKYLTKGDPGKTMVSLVRIDQQTIQETDERQGKVVDVLLYKIVQGGKSMHVVDHNHDMGTTTTFTADKKRP
jgi:hypothetical protein